MLFGYIRIKSFQGTTNYVDRYYVANFIDLVHHLHEHLQQHA